MMRSQSDPDNIQVTIDKFSGISLQFSLDGKEA